VSAFLRGNWWLLLIAVAAVALAVVGWYEILARLR
jgi:hypothetical protein